MCPFLLPFKYYRFFYIQTPSLLNISSIFLKNLKIGKILPVLQGKSQRSDIFCHSKRELKGKVPG